MTHWRPPYRPLPPIPFHHVPNPEIQFPNSWTVGGPTLTPPSPKRSNHLTIRAVHDGLWWSARTLPGVSIPTIPLDRLYDFVKGQHGVRGCRCDLSFSEIFRYLRRYIYAKEDGENETITDETSTDVEATSPVSAPYVDLSVGAVPSVGRLVQSLLYSGHWVGFGVGVPGDWWERGLSREGTVPLPGSTEDDLTGIAGSLLGWDQPTNTFIIYLPEGGVDTQETTYAIPAPYLTDMRYGGEIVAITEPIIQMRK